MHKERADKIEKELKIMGIHLPLASEKNNAQHLTEAYGALKILIDANSEWNEDALAFLSSGLMSKANDGTSLKEAYLIMADIIKARPDLSEPIVDALYSGLQSEQNTDISLYRAFSILSDVAKRRSDLSGKVLGCITAGVKLKPNDNSRDYFSRDYLFFAYDALYRIAAENPVLINDVLEALNIGLQSENNSKLALENACHLLRNIIDNQPFFAEHVLKILKNGFPAIKNTGNFSEYANNIYHALHEIIVERPDLAEDIFTTLNNYIRLNKNNQSSLDEAYSALRLVAKSQPNLAEQVLDTFEIAFQADSSSRNFAYQYLAIIVPIRPDLAERVLEMINNGLQSEKNNSHDIQASYRALQRILDERPDLADSVFKSFNNAIKLERNNSESLFVAYDVLSNISNAQPDLTNHILSTVYNGTKNTKNKNASLAHARVALNNIVKSYPDFAQKVVDMFSDVNLPNKLLLYKTCMKNLPLEETVAAHPEQAQRLLIAHKARFTNDNEFIYALEYINPATMAETNLFSAQQRLMNVLVTTSYMEEKSHEAAEYIEGQIFGLKCRATKCVLDKEEIKEKIGHWMPGENRSPEEIIRDLDEKKRELEKEIEQWQARKHAYEMQDGKDDPFIAEEINRWKEEALSFRKLDAPKEIQDYIKQNADWLIPASFKGVTVFKEYFPAYIKQIQTHNRKNPDDALSIHDAVYWLPEPALDRSENAHFAEFIRNNIIYQNAEHKMVHRPLEELKIIAQNWKSLENKLQEQGEGYDITKLKYSDVLSICMSVKYEDQRDEKFAAEAAKHAVDESQYHDCEDIYLAGLKVPEPFDSKKEFKEGKYTGRFLPRDDVRTGFFGDYTDCCQHFGGVGNSCAVSTVKHPFSQLFVIEDDKGKIIAGSWTWENTEGKYREVCFDNIESLGELKQRPEINQIYEQVGKYLTEEQNCRRVTIGLGYQDADVSGYERTEAIALPKLYGNDGTGSYSDARSQVLLAENQNAEPLDKSQESQRYIRNVCFLDMEAMDRISDTVFPDSDKQLQPPEDMSGLVIEDREKGVVGYCLYDKKEKSIYDMAVLPEYRTDKNASSKKLFAEMMRIIREEGGKWSAEMRDKTTLKYLEIMAERGLVKFEKHGVDHVMSDGSQVVEVTFEPVRDEVRQATNKLKGRVEEATAKTVDIKANTDNQKHGTIIVKDSDAREA